MKECRIVIGGCRNFNNYDFFKRCADECIFKLPKNIKITIVSGHCRGVDSLAERYAKENDYKLDIFPADWEKYGRAAGPIRNEKMVASAQVVLALWDYKSKGTKNLIENAQLFKRKLFIVKINQI